MNARAMSAVEYSVHLCEFLRCLNNDRFFCFGVLTVFFHHMESCDNIVGSVSENLSVSVNDIEDTVMGTARKQSTLAVLLYDKALLMTEIVTDLFAVFYAGQLFVPLWITTPAGDTTEQE